VPVTIIILKHASLSRHFAYKAYDLVDHFANRNFGMFDVRVPTRNKTMCFLIVQIEFIGSCKFLGSQCLLDETIGFPVSRLVLGGDHELRACYAIHNVYLVVFHDAADRVNRRVARHVR